MAGLKTAAMQTIVSRSSLKGVYGLVIKTWRADDCPSDERGGLQGNILKCLRCCTLASGHEPTKGSKLSSAPIAQEDQRPWNHNNSLAGPHVLSMRSLLFRITGFIRKTTVSHFYFFFPASLAHLNVCSCNLT
jgi:hypothetical protein